MINIQVYGIGNGVKLKSSLVSIQNFTQYLQLFLGFVMYQAIYSYCGADARKWHFLVKLLCYSGLTILLIGVYQIFAFYYGLPYDEIFRKAGMWQSKERVQATMPEASFLGQYCTYLIAIYFTWHWNKNRWLQYTADILVLFIGVMSRSSTFFLGAVVVFLFILFSRHFNFLGFMKYVAILFIFFWGVYYIIWNNVYFQRLQ